MESAIDETEVQQTSLQQNKPEMNTDLHTTAKASQSDALPFLPKLDQECLPTAAMPVGKDENCYNMNHKNRGKCIIFNHEEFEDSQRSPNREGSAKDASRLKTTFQCLGFDVTRHDNLTKNDIMNVIKEVSHLDHTDNDCLCIIVLTHGLDDDRLVAKDTEYKFDKLWKPFTANKCVTLAGKPKLFFIQACRGNKADSVVLLKNRSSNPVQQSGRFPEKDTVLCYAIPTHADFLLAQSTVKGFRAWRDVLEGTWYIQCLCDVLDEHGTTMDLMNMLTITARKVATEHTSIHVDDDLHNKKQIPSVTSMLIRLVYFSKKSVTDSGKNNK